MRAAEEVEVKIKETFGFVDALLKGGPAELFDKTVRVMRGRHGDLSNGHSRHEQAVEDTHRRLLARGVRIKTQHHLVDVALENSRMIRSKRRALRGHHVRHPCGMARD